MMNVTRNRKIAISAAIMMVIMVVLMPLAYAATSPSPAGTLPLNPANWVGLAFLGVMLIIAIAAMVYMLSGLSGSFNARSWALGQVYDGMISIALLLIFAAFAYLFFLNPQGALGPTGLNLVPSQCSGSTTLYTLSSCDIGMFSNNAYTLVQTLFYVSFFSGLSPGIAVSVNIPGLQGIGVQFSLSDIVPASEEDLLTTAFSVSFVMLVLNQLQVILISGALLFLAFFVTIGLVSRCFGITRTFGGAMIAVGLGLGLVYPLLVAIIYGYINVQVGTLSLWQLVGNLIQSVFTLLLAGLSGQFSSGSLLIFNPQFVQIIGFTIAGLTFIPFLNFVILDAFIRDFSKSIGEQVNFLQMLTGLI